MEEKFKTWLLEQRGYSEKGAVDSYPKAIYMISDHYSHETKENIDIYEITDQTRISAIAHDYSQTGKFAEFGYKQHGRFRAAIARYSEFLVHSQGGTASEDTSPNNTKCEETEVNFSYERDLQTTLCAQISELFPEYRIFGDSNLGIEYAIGNRRIDVLLEHIENKNLLIVELKSCAADYKIFGQISMYMGLIQKQFPDRDINGVIVAGSIDESLVNACETTNKISLKIYRMRLELEDI